MISLCVTWPTGFDYPIFRKHLPEIMQYVDEVVFCPVWHGRIVLSNGKLRQLDLWDWMIDNVQGAKFLPRLDAESWGVKQDWRDIATNRLIKNSKNGEWILFMEPDFFIKDFKHFFNTISTAQASNDVISFIEGERFHPAFLLVKRERLLKTSCDFSATNGFDHFGRVSEELKKYNYATLEELGLREDRDWTHLRGVTDNYYQEKPYFNLEEFRAYNKACMQVEPMSEYWMKEMERCDEIR